jgi:hypothetical protein
VICSKFLREELRLRMLGNRVLRRIFEPEIDGMLGRGA